MNKDKIKEIIEQIDKSKNIIAEERDRLRDIYTDLSMALESFDEGVEGLEIGIDTIRNAIDDLSIVV